MNKNQCADASDVTTLDGKSGKECQYTGEPKVEQDAYTGPKTREQALARREESLERARRLMT